MNMVQLDLECVNCGWSWRAYARDVEFPTATCEKCDVTSRSHKISALCRFTYDRDIVPANILIELDSNFALNKDELTVPVRKDEIDVVDPITGVFSKEIVEVPLTGVIPKGSFVSVEEFFGVKNEPIQQLPITRPTNLNDYEKWSSGGLDKMFRDDAKVIQKAKELWNSGMTVEQALATAKIEILTGVPTQSPPPPPRSPLVPVKRKFEFDGQEPAKTEEPPQTVPPWDVRGLIYSKVRCPMCGKEFNEFVNPGVIQRLCDDCSREEPYIPQYMDLY